MLKHQIHSKESIPPNKQQLTYAGKPLADNCTLEKYNIRESQRFTWKWYYNYALLQVCTKIWDSLEM